MIQIKNAKASTHSSIKGNFDVLFTDTQLTLKECRLILGKNGSWFIGFPSAKQTDGSFRQMVFMENEKNPVYEEILNQAMDSIISKKQNIS
jgi:DNA-binding cell septation regulator SpoVG